MKLTNTLSVLLISIGCWSCSGASSTGGNDSTAIDTIATSATEDSIQAQPELLVTPDLTLLEVKGNVKEIKGKETDGYIYRGSAKFNENGELTHYGCSDPIDKLSNVKRDQDGRLIKFLADEWITVKWNAERPISVNSQMNECSTTETYTYGDDGLTIKILYQWYTFDEEDGRNTSTITYPQDAFDEKGNWVKRVIKHSDRTITEEREIIYY